MSVTGIQIAVTLTEVAALISGKPMTTIMLTVTNELTHCKELLRSYETSIAEVYEPSCVRSYCWPIINKFDYY